MNFENWEVRKWMWILPFDLEVGREGGWQWRRLWWGPSGRVLSAAASPAGLLFGDGPGWSGPVLQQCIGPWTRVGPMVPIWAPTLMELSRGGIITDSLGGVITDQLTTLPDQHNRSFTKLSGNHFNMIWEDRSLIILYFIAGWWQKNSVFASS